MAGRRMPRGRASLGHGVEASASGCNSRHAAQMTAVARLPVDVDFPIGVIRPVPRHPCKSLQFRCKTGCRLVVLTLLLIVTRTLTAAAECDDRKPYVDKEFVIVKSTPAFNEATRSAAQVAAELGVALNLRGLSSNLRTGLTASKEECARSELPYPCYVPRGRSDDGTYVSVEWSSTYDLVARGLYIVMIASGVPGSSETRRMLEAARRVYPAAYAKRATLYVGCRH